MPFLWNKKIHAKKYYNYFSCSWKLTYCCRIIKQNFRLIVRFFTI